MKKYELTDETWTTVDGRTLHRIRAVLNVGDVTKGDLGGFIETEKNLSQDGYCWVYGDAQVYDNARVYGNAQIYGNAEIFGNAQVYDNAQVFGNAQVYGYAKIFDDARVFEDARVSDAAQVYSYAIVYGSARYGCARVHGSAQVHGDARISGNAQVVCTTDWLTVGPIGSRNGMTTFFRCTDGKIRVTCGCFYGDLDEFAKKVTQTHGNSKYALEYRAAIELAKVGMTME